MRILAGWDDPAEAKLLQLYLAGCGDNDVFLTNRDDAFLTAAAARTWDVVLHTLAFPSSADEGFAIFTRLQQLLPGVPIVLACRPAETINLPRFMLRGLRSYLFRDAQGDFMFLVLSILDSAVNMAQAEKAQRLAEQLRQEIDGVRTLQEAILPHGLTPPQGYRAVARYEPAQVTVLGGQPVVLAGGDYYNLYCPDGHTLTALIGDASGHGLKACMAIMIMHTLVRMMVDQRFRDTAGFVNEINRLLCSNSIVQSGGGFITLLYVSFDTTTHQASWTSAGHPLPLLHRLDTNEIIQVGANSDGGLPLGISLDLPYEASSFCLPPRNRLLLYTDGLTDALSEEAAFGVSGIRDALVQCRDRTLEDTIAHLFKTSSTFTDGQGRHDDTSVLLLERTAES